MDSNANTQGHVEHKFFIEHIEPGYHFYCGIYRQRCVFFPWYGSAIKGEDAIPDIFIECAFIFSMTSAIMAKYEFKIDTTCRGSRFSESAVNPRISAKVPSPRHDFLQRYFAWIF